MFRKICPLCLAALLLALVPNSTVWNAAPEPRVHVVADGYLLGFEVGPLIREDRVLVSWRNLALFYGFALEYDEPTQRVTTRRADRTVVLTVGSTQALVNGKAVSLDVAPSIEEGRLMIPLRFAAEGLGLAVSWDVVSRTAHLQGGREPAPPVPTLTLADIKSAQLVFATSLDSSYISQEITPATPEGAALLERVSAGWRGAVPGVFATEGFMLAGLTPPQLRLYLTDGMAYARLVPHLRGNSGGWNAKGFLELEIRRPGREESALVYAPELAALIGEISLWPSPPE